MRNTLDYKGYHGSVEYNSEDKILHGKVLGIRSMITYKGNDVETIEQDFRESVDAYLDMCERRGIAPEKEYSGLFQVRVSPETHRTLAIKAEASNKKLNTIVVEALEKYIVAF